MPQICLEIPWVKGGADNSLVTISTSQLIGKHRVPLRLQNFQYLVFAVWSDTYVFALAIHIECVRLIALLTFSQGFPGNTLWFGGVHR